MPIATVEDRHGPAAAAARLPVLGYVAARWGQGRLPDAGSVSDVAAVAVVNHGRWVVRCPFAYQWRGCRGAEMASLDDRRFWCCHCANAAVGGRWIGVVFPVERVAIEKVLAMRPDVQTQNWEPGESVEHLLAENAAHGIDESSVPAMDNAGVLVSVGRKRWVRL